MGMIMDDPEEPAGGYRRSIDAMREFRIERAILDCVMDFDRRIARSPKDATRHRLVFPHSVPESVREAVRAHYEQSGMEASLSTDLGNPCLDLRRKQGEGR